MSRNDSFGGIAHTEWDDKRKFLNELCEVTRRKKTPIHGRLAEHRPRSVVIDVGQNYPDEAIDGKVTIKRSDVEGIGPPTE